MSETPTGDEEPSGGHDAIVRSLIRSRGEAPPEAQSDLDAADEGTDEGIAAVCELLRCTFGKAAVSADPPAPPQAEDRLLQVSLKGSPDTASATLDPIALRRLCEARLGRSSGSGALRGRVVDLLLAKFAISLVSAAMPGKAFEFEAGTAIPASEAPPVRKGQRVLHFDLDEGRVALVLPTVETAPAKAEPTAVRGVLLPARLILFGPALTLGALHDLHVGQVLTLDGPEAAVQIEGEVVRTGQVTQFGPKRALALAGDTGISTIPPKEQLT